MHVQVLFTLLSACYIFTKVKTSCPVSPPNTISVPSARLVVFHLAMKCLFQLRICREPRRANWRHTILTSWPLTATHCVCYCLWTALRGSHQTKSPKVFVPLGSQSCVNTTRGRRTSEIISATTDAKSSSDPQAAFPPTHLQASGAQTWN